MELNGQDIEMSSSDHMPVPCSERNLSSPSTDDNNPQPMDVSNEAHVDEFSLTCPSLSPPCAETSLRQLYAYLQAINEHPNEIRTSDCEDAVEISYTKNQDNLTHFLEQTAPLLSQQLDQENVHGKAEIEFMLEKIGKKRDDLLPHKSTEQCEKSLSKDIWLTQVKELQSAVSKILNEICPVDIDSLLRLLKANSHVGDMIDGKAVLLLLGATGSGKTTTLHFLAGSSFVKEEIDGFDHLKIVDIKYPKLAEFKTSSRTKSETRVMQSVEVDINGMAGAGAAGSNVVLCDSPGFHDTEGVEIDIANGWGIVCAIRRAKIVKPILILSKDGMGDRFQTLTETLLTVRQMMMGEKCDASAMDVRAFKYVFTKYPTNFQDRLCKQFQSMNKDLPAAKKSDKMFASFVEDMILKTSPKAKLVVPLDDNNPQELLQSLLSGTWIQHPRESFFPFISDASRDKLNSQLRMTLCQLERALQRKDVATASYRLTQLTSLAEVLPQANKVAADGRNAVKNVITRHHESVLYAVGLCWKLRNNAAAFEQQIQVAKCKLERFLHFDEWMTMHELKESCANCIQSLIKRIAQDLDVSRVESLPLVGLVEEKQTIVQSLDRLHHISTAFDNTELVYTNASLKYQECSSAIEALVTRVLQSAEQRATVGLLPHMKELSLEISFLCYIIGALSTERHQTTTMSKLKLRQESLLSSLQLSIAACAVDVKTVLSANMNHSELSNMLAIGDTTITTRTQLLSSLATCPELIQHVPSITQEWVENETQMIDSLFAKFICKVVSCCECSINAVCNARPSGNIDDLMSSLAQANKHICSWRSVSLSVSTLSNEDYKRLIGLNSFITDYVTKLYDVPEDLGRAMVVEAERILLQINDGRLSAFLKELSGVWDEWSKFIESAKRPVSKNWDKLLAMFFITSVVASNRENVQIASRLKSTRDQIEQNLQAQLFSVSRDLCSTFWDASSVTKLFTVLRHEVLVFIEFIEVERSGSSFAQQILDAQCPNNSDFSLRKIYANARQALANYLDKLAAAIPILLNDKSFTDVNKILTSFRDEQSFWARMSFHRSYARGGNSDRMIPQRGVTNCTNYAALHELLTAVITDVQTKVCNVNFLDEQQVDSVNEHDRNKFYKEVASFYSATVDIHCLVDHVAVVDVKSIRKMALDHLHQQTEKVSRFAIELLTTFPEVECDYRKICVWYGNLISIENAFADVASSVSRLSSRSQDSINRRLYEAILTTFSKWKTTTCPVMLISCIIQLKKATLEMVYWRDEINRLIDDLLRETSSLSSSSGQFILNVGLELGKLEEETSSAVAKQLLAEHECFKGAMNAVFNSATARQGIDYVVSKLGIPKDRQQTLKIMYQSFSEDYRAFVKDGLVVVRGDESFFDNLVGEAQDIAMDYCLDYRERLIALTACVFAYWSLKSAKSFLVVANKEEDSSVRIEDDGNGFMMKPHAAQVVAVWMLLNYQHEEYRILRNHLIQISTGEGKSIILGVTAIILAMMGCEVECVCYSSYLSKRDYKAFETMFNDFRVAPFIKYGTIDDMCNRVLDQGGNIRDLTSEAVLKQYSATSRVFYNEGNDRSKVLLIDEVDVLFKDDFYGNTYNPLAYVQDVVVSDLINYISLKRDTLCHKSLLATAQASKCLSLFSEDSQCLISYQISEMLKDSNRVDSHEYIILPDKKIGYKNLDGVCCSTFHGYLTAFAAMKEHDNDRVSKSHVLERQLLTLRCGKLSYSEIPVLFDHIFGVTGTLEGLSVDETRILKEKYEIEEMTMMPSVYGNNKLLFSGDSSRDVILCSSVSEHFLEIRDEINARRKCEQSKVLRAVMVFFESSKELLSFYESEHMDDLKGKTCTIIESVNPLEKSGAFLRATQAEAVTLMIREFGRGTDFKCFDSKMIDAGGVHVIQTFFSLDVSEEIQIKGRTARQGAKGSYSMVLNTEKLQSEFNITSVEIETMRTTSRLHSYLKTKRECAYIETCKSREGKVKAAEALHYETMEYKKCLLQGNRERILAFLYKNNGFLTLDGVPSLSYAKESLLNDKKSRDIKVQNDEKLLREKETRVFRERVLLLTNASTEADCYDLLEVSRTASNKQIKSAFRRLSRKYHPEKNKALGTSERFQRLCEARDILLSLQKRAEYDRKLDNDSL